MTSVAKRFGKYRATVVDNRDPLARGRLRLAVPALPGVATNWAEACLPFAVAPAVPPVGAAVWAEFEGGDVALPIWTGCRVTTTSATGEIALRSPGGHAVAIDDGPPSPTTGGVVVQGGGGATIVVNDSGIFLSNGKGATVTLIGPTTAINGDALSVT